MSVLLCLPAQIDSAVVEMLSESGQTHLIARRCADLAEVLAGARARIASLAIISEDLDFLDLTLISELRQYVGVAVVLNTATDGLHSSQRISSRDLRSLGDVEILSPAPRVWHGCRQCTMEDPFRLGPTPVNLVAAYRHAVHWLRFGDLMVHMDGRR